MSTAQRQLAIEKTMEVSKYMKASLRRSLQNATAQVDIPDDWTLEFTQDCAHMVHLLVKALRNQVSTSWSAVAYAAALQSKGSRCTGQQAHIENALMNEFPPLARNYQEFKPSIILDNEGRILMWYLPGILSRTRQHHIWDLTPILEKRLKMTKGGNWRTNRDNFLARDTQYQSGTMNFALAWYQQAMQKTLPMEVSAELRCDQTLEWMTAMSETFTLLGGLTSILNPHVFNAGVDIIRAIYTTPEIVEKRESLPEILAAWSTPFTALSVMNNRKTPVHRDNGSGFTANDMLITIGPYINGILDLPSLGCRFRYNSATVVSFSGRLLSHAASADGERLCIAQYLRESVLQTFHIQDHMWTSIADIL